MITDTHECTDALALFWLKKITQHKLMTPYDINMINVGEKYGGWPNKWLMDIKGLVNLREKTLAACQQFAKFINIMFSFIPIFSTIWYNGIYQ